MKFKIVDSQNNHKPVKSGFISASKAQDWCKKNLPEGSWANWGKVALTRYYITGYNA